MESMNGPQIAEVRRGEQIAWSSDAQMLVFNPDYVDATASTRDPFTKFRLEVVESGQYYIFTQHVPSEFLANHLSCEACATKLLFPDETRMYIGGALPTTTPLATTTSPEKVDVTTREETDKLKPTQKFEANSAAVVGVSTFSIGVVIYECLS